MLLLIPSAFLIREENKKRERERRGVPKAGREGAKMRSERLVARKERCYGHMGYEQVLSG